MDLSALALSLQLEAGVSLMEKPEDDVYVQYKLPGANDSVRFTSPAFGAALRLDTQRFQLSLGWRDLGNQHLNANIIGDEDYFRHHWDSAYKARWYSTGSESQVYAEFGYKAHILGTWDLVPSFGIADNRTTWHYQVYWHGGPQHWCIAQPNQHDFAPFVGASLQHGPVGVGAYLLETAPPHSNNDFGGQGEHAVYVRVTYAIGEVK